MGAREPGGVGVEPEEGDHAEDHEVGVDAENDAAVIPAPAAAHVAGGIEGADERAKKWEAEQVRGVVGRELREPERDEEAEGDHEIGAEERTESRVEEERNHCSIKDRPGVRVGSCGAGWNLRRMKLAKDGF